MNSMLLDSPAVTDGISVWEIWLNRLEEMKGVYPYEHAIDSEIKRTKKIIMILTKYPQGLNATDPNFKSLVKEIMNANE